WNAKEDIFLFSGQSYLLEEQMKKLGIDRSYLKRELHRRKTVLEWMVRKNIRRYKEVANVIREYYANPNRVFQKARVGLK
ncbi:secretion system protein E, partial [Candidatus Bathyarchaeota archaeon]